MGCLHYGGITYQADILYYKIGVGLLELITTSPQQLDWLNPTPDDTRLMSVLDKMNQRYGRDTLFLTAQDIDQK